MRHQMRCMFTAHEANMFCLCAGVGVLFKSSCVWGSGGIPAVCRPTPASEGAQLQKQLSPKALFRGGKSSSLKKLLQSVGWGKSAQSIVAYNYATNVGSAKGGRGKRGISGEGRRVWT